MSALGPKQTWAGALQMSAFGGKADIVLNEFYEYTPKLLGVSTKRQNLCLLVPFQRSAEHRRADAHATSCKQVHPCCSCRL
jgi:hypothetical protein